MFVTLSLRVDSKQINFPIFSYIDRECLTLQLTELKKK